MAKTSTKFTAQFIAKIGKTPVEFIVKLDLTEGSDTCPLDEFMSDVMSMADQQLDEMVSSVKIKLTNAKELKAARKAYVKAAKASKADDFADDVVD